ncbi:aminotransferase class V-fold PLP-dependent enzyme [Caulobacter sp. NIBR2454]|uniref:aminotransferase class V-fold PLP-dependent enzyme n=1 Tax=Caulobacter sp. NIBR2454 TaxID=3015996 RepID=UPI0022B69304|nr:aminotransferase class V-fold PLP-dependent enzyme [Caulobacter sp. NIBR2454]
MEAPFGRRQVLGLSAAISLAATARAGHARAQLSDLWDVDRDTVNLDAAYYGAMPKAVQAAYFANLSWVNQNNSAFLRRATKDRSLDDSLTRSRAAAATLINASPEEVALCNGGTEALYALITNYRDLKPGDTVIIADVDYDEMQYAMAFLQESRGARLVRFDLGDMTDPQEILAAYQAVLDRTPRAKLLLLTHLSNRNGLVPPVKAIITAARARGVDVILDSAQAVAQLPVDVEDLGADFVGFSLHKWLAAPLGTGGIYIRKDRQASIAPYMGNGLLPAADVRSRILTGTINYAAHLTIPDALAFHESIGAQAKLARLRELHEYWIDRVRDMPALSIVGPSGEQAYGAIGAFRPRGLDGIDGARRLQARMLERHGVLVVAKAGLASGPVLRVTPALFNTTADLDRLVSAVRAELAA